MQIIFFFSVIVAFLCPCSANAKDITASSKIDTVTVFSNMALVARTAKLEIPSGNHKIVFNNLPAKLDKNSLRVKGNGSVIIGSIESRKVSSKELVQEKERELNKLITDLHDKNRTIQMENQSLHTQKKFIENIGKYAPDNINEEIKRGEIKPEKWETAWKTIGEGVAETNQALLKNEFTLRENNKEIQKLYKELRNIRTGSKDSIQVQINVKAKKTAKIKLVVLYQINEASWSPLYDARLDTKTAKLSLTQHGQVKQRTGENWEDVALTLSTARPSQGTQMPTIDTWWINFIQPQIYKERKERIAHFANKAGKVIKGMAIGRRMMTDEEDSMSPPVPEAVIQQAAIVASEFAAEFVIHGSSSVPADNALHKFAINTYKMDTKITVQITPKLSTKAYLHTKAKYNGKAPLLFGKMNLFRDEAFIGKARLKKLRPDDELKLSFGIDDKVAVSRRLLEGETSELGLISKEKRIERKYRTKVENLHKMPVSIIVFDNVPVSQNKDIIVEILDEYTTPKYERNYEDKTGVLSWDFEYQPKEKKNIDLGYSIRYPKDKRIDGI
ncbi:MAG: mucoidy inhibitor MuiA family protein [Alphaproteobacteria bacterium]|nr:mucoidy inhibitor MuiA family protein [Alphaproteobacteria bacterium]